jgi:hypothetical protein
MAQNPEKYGEPIDDDGTYGGFAAIAQRLNELHPYRERPYSRQLIHAWFVRYQQQGFPSRYAVRTRTGMVKHWFRIADCLAWYRLYRMLHGDSVGSVERTLPLFDLDTEVA